MQCSARETQVLELLKRGQTNKEIAQTLGISPHTVRDHVSHLLARFGLCSRAALAAFRTHMEVGAGYGPRLERPGQHNREPLSTLQM